MPLPDETAPVPPGRSPVEGATTVPEPSPPAPDGVAQDVQELVLGTRNVEQFLDQVVHLAAAAIDGDVSVGITLAREGRAATVASTDAATARYDELQYRFDQGPCLTCMRTNSTIVIDDLEQDARWGPYQPHALAEGLRSSLSIPLDAGSSAIGALNMYSATPSFFGEPEREVVARFGAEASRALALVIRLVGQAELNEQLQTALASRTVIDKAIGIIMAQSRCDASAAFEILRRGSQNRNVKLRTLAAEIVTAVGGTQSLDAVFGTGTER
jgi:GAF domain-containing protein